MANVIIEDTYLSDIADAIREKKGEEETYKPSEMADGISSIQTGADLNDYFNMTPETMSGDSNVPWLVNNYFKKFPPVIVPNNITHLNYLTNGLQRWSMPELPKIICGNNITNMSYMYYNNTTITDIDVSGLDTSNVVTMDNMFSNCINIKNFDLSTFDTRKVQNMASMFIGDAELLSITFGENFKTEAVTNLSAMFNTCTSLVSLDLSQFYTPNVTNVSSMFASCSNLTHLDIRNFDFSNVTNHKNFLRYMSTDCEIIVKDATQKAWINEKFPTMTNVKTVEEYENQ